jgi:alginate O-acetyltransferase complex protein AlgI
MLFSSIIFIFYFLPVFLAVYLMSGLRTSVLLTGSVLFYTWGEGEYILLLGGLIVLNYWLAGKLAAREGRARLGMLVLALAVDLGVLGLFKYGNFISDIGNDLLGAGTLPHPDLRLPLGISFFTFQLVSYLVDVYRGQVQPESKLARFATYILMFPHLIAGPIVRYAEIRDELAVRTHDFARFGLGLQYFIVGLCQKVLVANTLAPLADHAFGLHNSVLDAGTAWLGLLAYTLQIFFDFCGYSNMAIGLAFMFGFTFPRNFDYPYSSRSISEFWRRWHMSLSFWFRDYVYIPLGGNRGGTLATLRNLGIVFFLTGLWHGAAWNFIFWGLFHGAFLLAERQGVGALLRRLPSPLAWAYTVLAVMVGWVFFRADSLSHAVRYLRRMFSPSAIGPLPVDTGLLLTPEVMMAIVAGVALSFPLLPALLDRIGVPRIERSPRIPEQRLDTHYVHALPVALLLAGFVLSCALLAGTSLNPFLYFRF